MPISVTSLDHLVITCSDLDRTAAFYQRLGMSLQTFGDHPSQRRQALTFGPGTQKINLHQVGKEFDPHADKPTPGSQDLCFVVEMPIEEVCEQLESEGIAIELGPVDREGARGKMRSVYVRDPDRNLVELASYGKAA
ncbi:Glyoxalase/Bleomycin resistance protein/Dihydroxybiphenyl dioxygenase [Microstroma glucosiphilum]|uniref:Glyoxalase/Bleomycin resistance protein/Dihydroxybiphenyl dioxygenase n=1 Tax=Pseudomicrostroma glucosiphilum TaxID=1684307 RepID=A0A316U9G2_9BASI|nr:Glyoxalase/Bleomycin resistance protein/Dihydroxybiphenyl dioxygenase [Pseudomicrostroma glucosiphilum]PWN21484.1 Glyoxalase/Bleomycin resistance protein/Dihydroxybiphenyl dioxygenase [Pseudomicrostroma glucosiphilum]